MELQDFGRSVEWPADDASEHEWADRVQPVLERGGHPEIAATTAQCPEELGIGVVAAHEKLTVGGHDLDREQVVAAETEPTRQPAEPAAERQTRDASRGDD